MPKARYQHIHGTGTKFEEFKDRLLDDEIGIVNSGDLNSKSGSAVYYKVPGKKEPIRLANDDDVLKIYKINASTVPESVDWYDRQDNPYIPTTFSGLTGEAPELVFWEENQSIWLLISVVYQTQDQPIYHWRQMLTTDDL